MKMFFDMLPVILFFVAYWLTKTAPTHFPDLAAHVAPDDAIYVATGIAIVVSVLQIAWLAARRKHIDGMQWTSLAIVAVFGGMTLVFHDETFIKWKPTVLYLAFAATLIGARFGFGRNLIRRMMDKQVALPDPVWERLNIAWAAFFMLLAVLNIVIAYRYPTDVWVDFKLFGSLGLTIAFVLAQGVYLSRYVQEE